MCCRMQKKKKKKPTGKNFFDLSQINNLVRWNRFATELRHISYMIGSIQTKYRNYTLHGDFEYLLFCPIFIVYSVEIVTKLVFLKKKHSSTFIKAKLISCSMEFKHTLSVDFDVTRNGFIYSKGSLYTCR